MSNSIISHNRGYSRVKINEFGEKEVKKLKQTQKTLSEAEIAEMIEAYRAGRTVYELSDQYGAHRVTISRILKKYGINVTKSKGQAKLDVEKAIKMYAEYHTTSEIAKLYDVHPNCIIRCLREHGVKIRNRWDYPRE